MELQSHASTCTVARELELNPANMFIACTYRCENVEHIGYVHASTILAEMVAWICVFINGGEKQGG